MNPPRQLRIRKVVTYVPAISGTFVGMVGLLVLVGWTFDIEVFKNLLHPGRIAMNPATAVSMLLLALGLWVIRNSPPPRSAVMLARVFAIVVLCVALGRLSDICLGTHLEFDRILFRARLESNVISPNSALSFLLLGTGLLFFDFTTRNEFHPAQIVVITAGCAGLLSLVGYLYQAERLYGIHGYIPMALNTAICFVALSIGFLCTRPNREPLRALLSDTLGGVVARRLVPAAFLVPLIAGKLQILGAKLGLYFPDFGLAVLVLLNILVFNILIWWCANAMRVSDVRRRRISEEALRNSDERNRAIMEQAAEGIFLVDLETRRIIDANLALERMLGYGRGEIREKSVYDLVDASRENIDLRLKQMVETEKPLHGQRLYKRKDGSTLQVESSAGVISFSGRRVVCSAVHDITERKKAEEALAAERNLLRTLIDNIPDSIFIKDAMGKYITCNAAHARFAGVASPEQIVGKSVYDLHPRATADAYANFDRAVFQTGKPLLRHEESLTDCQGNVQWAVVSKIPIYDPHGEVIGLVGITRDITQQKKADETLASERNLLRTVIDNLPERIYVKDLQGKYMLDNAAHLEHLKLTDPSQVVGKTTRDFFPPELAEQFERDDHAVVESKTPLLDREEKAGDAWLLTTKVPLTGANGEIRGLVGMSRDITARKRAEQQLEEKNQQLEEAALSERKAYDKLKSAQSQLVQSEKLAGLGQMVAGVAHEINNPLSFVSNNVAVLQRDIRGLTDLLALYAQADTVISSNDSGLMVQIKDLCDRMDLVYTQKNMRELLDRSREGLRRIQQIVKDLRDFARLDESDLHEVDLNDGIHSTVNIVMGKAKKKRVQVDMKLDPLPFVSCYPAKINQVVMNLVSNAIDACPEGGRVTIATSANGDNIHIRVSDSGPGVPQEIRGRIFDPFFTTKPIGEGTGLGLSISYGIVHDHGGDISVGDAPGGGAMFEVVLPKKCPPKAANTSP